MLRKTLFTALICGILGLGATALADHQNPTALSGTYKADPAKKQFGGADFWTLKLSVKANGSCKFSSDEEGIDCDADDPDAFCSREDMEDPSNRESFAGTCEISGDTITLVYPNTTRRSFGFSIAGRTLTLTNDEATGSAARSQTMMRK
jgi:hypothetical protein